MSVTYTTDTDAASAARTSDTAAPFVPIYARNRKARRSKGGVKTWMILAPIAFVTLGGLGALAFFSGQPASVAAPEAAPPAPIAASQPVTTDVATAPMTAAAPTPVEAAPTPAPVVRQAAPAAASTPARRTTPRAAPRTAAPVVEAEPTLTGPQPYNAAPAATAPASPTATLNRAPVTVAPAPVPAAPATPPPTPVIITPPAG